MPPRGISAGSHRDTDRTKHRCGFTVGLCIILCAVLSPDRGLGQGPIFTAQPNWTYEANAGFQPTVPIDIDRDGDLDLMIFSGVSRLLRNQSPTRFFAESAIPDILSNSSISIVGDVNRDGFVDILHMTSYDPPNSIRRAELTLNDAGVLRRRHWVSAYGDYHEIPALADLDLDGYLDLVCVGGNGPGYLAYYLNLGTERLFPSSPDAMSEFSAAMVSIAAGDLDGDGDLDLVLGTDYAPDSGLASVLLLFNRGPGAPEGLFPQNPDWAFQLDGSPQNLTLGDIDGDGDLDLIAGSASKARLYLNRHSEGAPWTASAFDESVAWEFSTLTVSLGPMAVGDLDGDGDLDLLLGSTSTATANQLFLNQGAPFWFDTEGIPLSGAGQRLRHLVIGDFDGDGGLDLILQDANSSYLELYLNQSPRLAVVPEQPMYLPLATRALAAGDVDNDGDVDLVTGNEGQGYLYRNRTYPEADSVFPPVGESINRFAAAVRSVLLVDLDLDGYPELVFGNHREPNSVYRNLAGSFEAYPAWTSPDNAATTSLAAGDLNGDGRPDLLCGNANARNRAILNQDGTLAAGSYWESVVIEATQAVALADLDLDGDLDAVFGNLGKANTVYLNSGSNLADAPVWASREKLRTTSVAVGDVDGDGYPDLVCGNDGQANQLYLNSLGALAQGLNTVPYWSSAEADSTRSIALVDVDSDGDLDLVCGNAGSETTCYINAGGGFPAEASWRAATAMNTQAVALADFDLDGSVDLVCGNRGQVNTLHYGLRHPLLPWDLSQPAHHLPDNPTMLSGFRVVRTAVNRYAITLTVSDAESDPVGLVLRYRYADSPLWHPVELELPSALLATSPAGETHEFAWDISRLPFDRRDVVLGVVTSPSPQRCSDIRQMDAIEFALGPLAIRRSRLEAPPELNFDRVTVGDTVSAPMIIANTGNADLDVSEIRLPSAAMWLSRGAPIRVPPGTTVRDTVFLAPVEEPTIAGAIAIDSNDPLVPQLGIPVVTDIRRLTAETQPLLEGDSAPLGEALTIQVIPDEGVRVERGALHYRRGVGGGSFTAIEMAPSGRSFIGIVPGRDVTEVGLEYFVELENSGVFATDPADTAGGRFFAVAASIPTMITTQPVPTSGADYLAGREIAILVTLAQGVVYEQGTLHCRRGGESEYTSIPILEAEPLPAATIPDSMIGPQGVEYWAEVQTGSAELTDPPTDPAGHPHTIRVRVPDLTESVPHAGYQYRMVSVPLDFGDDFTGTLEALLSDQAAFGPYPAEPYDLGQWRCFRGFPPDGAPRELPAGPADDFRVEPGRGFWLISRSDHVIATSPLAGTSTPTDGAFAITLTPGWNMIGQPFAFPVAWDSVLVGGQAASSAGVEGPWFFDGTTYVEVTSLLEPFTGYWVRNNTSPPHDLVLSVPPVSPGDAAAVKGRAGGPDGHVVWQLTVTAACGGVQDGANRIGVCAGASDTWDVRDRREPPPAPERSLSLAFPHDAWADQAGRYTVDYRAVTAAAGGGHAWRFDVAKDFRDDASGNTVVLEFAGLQNVPAGLGVSLLDRELDRIQDLRQSARYSFHLGTRDPVTTEAEARFVVLVGDPAYVDGQLDVLNTPPVLTTLHQNYPNPFNPETVIRFDVAEAGPVGLKIYDLTGALVRTLNAGVLTPGGHEFVWHGEDDRGHQVASGVYVYRLQAGTALQTRRMTLLK